MMVPQYAVITFTYAVTEHQYNTEGQRALELTVVFCYVSINLDYHPVSKSTGFGQILSQLVAVGQVGF
jgi:hypothetical protein